MTKSRKTKETQARAAVDATPSITSTEIAAEVRRATLALLEARQRTGTFWDEDMHPTRLNPGEDRLDQALKAREKRVLERDIRDA